MVGIFELWIVKNLIRFSDLWKIYVSYLNFLIKIVIIITSM